MLDRQIYYRDDNGASGTVYFVSDAPLSMIQAFLAAPREDMHLCESETGVTVDDVLERLRIELVARQIEGRL